MNLLGRKCATQLAFPFPLALLPLQPQQGKQKTIENMRKTFILLATYNGAQFLDAQLKSIQEQEITDWTLLVRDDGSRDHTKKILDEYSRMDARIRLISGPSKNLGAIENFNLLMHEALARGAEIIFFSDQDDVWLPGKMKDQMKRLENLESTYDKATPLLIHSDLEVVDEQLTRIHHSSMLYYGLVPNRQSPLRILLGRNYVTGCTTLINRPLLELAVPIPKNIIMHDWWLALCAGACGVIGYVDRPTVLYRQHHQNQIVASKQDSIFNPFRLKIRKRWENGTRNFLHTLEQASSLVKRIEERCRGNAGEAIRMSSLYATCLNKPGIRRAVMMYKLGIQRQTLLRSILFYVRLLLMKTQ